ncbi:uncharacterized protein F5Z01DRAFT_230921 [Emericellopsis atlantica]|uniref:Uncharacterized protein n=1 Tax=Emericellopsis atlantica TaxID=2614577 RepID=A0A9P7ZI52_9HYPO|nr:uncharacterized protein F5Z01DRAFT_230921 [Emericellopsis atlantica]KAG9252489.1 hypothetical protein F5Z01DRAFT_230921 [Emericellopsis atlantica]
MLFSTKTCLAVVAVLARATAGAPAGSTNDALDRLQDVAREARQLEAVTAAAAEKRQYQICDCPEGLECMDSRILAMVGTIAPEAQCVLPSTKRDIEASAAEAEKRQQRAKVEGVAKRQDCDCGEGYECTDPYITSVLGAVGPFGSEPTCVLSHTKRTLEAMAVEVERRQVAEAEAVEKRESCACPDGFSCMVQSFEMLAVAPQAICVPSSTKRDLETRAAEAEKRQQQRGEAETVEKRTSCDCPEGDVCLPNSPAEVFSGIQLGGPSDICVSPTTKRDIEALTAEVQKRQVADAEGEKKPPACDCAEGETCSLVVMPITSNKAASTYMCV